MTSAWKGSRIEKLYVKHPNGTVYVLLIKREPMANKVVILEKQKVNDEPVILGKRGALLSLNRR